MYSPVILRLFFVVSLVAGHARIKLPRPLAAAPENPSGNYYNAPLRPDGSEFPCKGLHKRADVDKTPTETWEAGKETRFEILGHGGTGGEGSLAAHSGGSCQASISFDNGETWKVLHSFHGGCPRGVRLGSNMAGPDQVFRFMVPSSTRAGNALFSWSWVAATGNRNEFYQNCASVRITGSGTSTLDHLPDMFVGDMTLNGHISAGQCRSTANYALEYLNPGPAVTVTEVSNIPLRKPTGGKCYSRASKTDEVLGGGSSTTVASSTAQPTTTTTVRLTTTTTARVTTTVARGVSTTTTSRATTTVSSGVTTTGGSSVNRGLPSQCTSYTTISDGTRHRNQADSLGCDNTVFGAEPKWIRFTGAAGTRLATGPISGFKCGTQGTGWYNGEYPTSGQTVSGKVCFGWPGSDCHWSTTVSITNCNDFYVFALRSPPACRLRYCTV